MSAQIIPFPVSCTRAPGVDAMDTFVNRLAETIAELPPVEDDTLKLLRRIDRKLAKLIKAVEVQHG